MTSLSDRKSLVRLTSPTPSASAPSWRIVACPPSGAGAQFYRPLVRPGVEVWSARYPGRESRLGEPLACSIAALAQELTAAALPILGADSLPTVLLGHSMGVAVAVEAALRLERKLPGRLALVALSARTAPAARDAADDAKMRRIAGDDTALRAWLASLGGTPQELIDDDDFMAMQLPILRADLLASLAYAGPDLSRPIDTPLLLICGDADPAARLEDLAGWAHLTHGPVSRLRLEGGHHALLTDADSAMEAMEP